MRKTDALQVMALVLLTSVISLVCGFIIASVILNLAELFTR